MLFFPREVFARTNGYEERMRTYGYEDNDFSNRVRSLGDRLKWEGADAFRAYHIWHERPGLLAKTDKTLAAEYAANRHIFLSNRSYVRNVVSADFDREPLVTVAIATRDRAEMLRTAVASVLCQSVQSFEVVVVDDGSTDHTAAVLREFGDPRIRYFAQEQAGISVARNRALVEARGRFTAVMDDDDIMPPWRLERSFERIHAGEHGCVGSFVTFDDVSGELMAWGDPYPTLLGATKAGGFAGHPTWMVRTDVMRAFEYDESFTSAVDNNIALRMVRAGVKLRHSGEILNLRRVHGGQVTSHDAAFQGRGARLDAAWLRAGTTAQEWRTAIKDAEPLVSAVPPSSRINEVVPYLPDHLVCRQILVRSRRQASADSIRSRFESAGYAEVLHEDGSTAYVFSISDASWVDCAYISGLPETTITKWAAHLRADVSPSSTPQASNENREFLRELLDTNPTQELSVLKPSASRSRWLVSGSARSECLELNLKETID